MPDKELSDVYPITQFAKGYRVLIKNRVCPLQDTHARYKISFKVPFHCRNFPWLLPLPRILSVALQLQY